MAKPIQSLNIFKKVFILIAALSILNCKKMNDYESINLASAIPPSLLETQPDTVPTPTSGNSEVTGNFDADFKAGSALYTKNCAECHGTLSLSNKAKSSVALIDAAVQNVPQMSHLKILTDNEIALISLALTGPSETVTSSGKTLFICDKNSVRKNPTLKLSNKEFSIALSKLLNDFSANATTPLSNDTEFQNLLNALPNDISQAQFAAKENSFFLSQAMINSIFNATYRAAKLTSTAATGLTNYPNTASCLQSATITQVCHQSYVRELAIRAFRRRVTTTEANTIAATIWNTSLSKADLLTETFATVVSYPDFVYKVYNTGADDTTLARTVNITDLELANKLALFLTGQSANSTLRALAESGGLNDAVTFKNEVNRLIASAEGRSHLQKLFRESYGYDVNSDLQYNAAFLNGASTSNLKSAMVAELDNFFVNEVITKKSRFQDLMLSRDALVNQTSLAQIYGVAANASAFITLPDDRPGFLTRAAILTKKSGYYTSPIKRGHYIMEQVLCESVGDPPANAPTNVSEVQPSNQLLSTRMRYQNLTEQAGTTCLGCHSQINPFGFAFEGYDSLGRKRTQESIFNTSTGQLLGKVSVNTSTSALTTTSNQPEAIINANDMANSFATSDKAIMCFAKHLKSFDIRQPASGQDFCHMNEVLNIMYGDNNAQGTIVDAVIAYVSSKEFKSWKY